MIGYDIPKGIDDETVERIWEEAREAALHTSALSPAKNPYPPGSDEADVWAHAYGHHLAQDWH
ncbi:MAG: hypothetical protein KDK08_05310 [Rhizobiaceae bacterium]|nr:hypothetical protein [Rhizobiaceae bacterium]MCC0000888.1 hypothetical protein [Methylobacteriaceae bacterium]